MSRQGKGPELQLGHSIGAPLGTIGKTLGQWQCCTALLHKGCKWKTRLGRTSQPHTVLGPLIDWHMKRQRGMKCMHPCLCRKGEEGEATESASAAERRKRKRPCASGGGTGN